MHYFIKRQLQILFISFLMVFSSSSVLANGDYGSSEKTSVPKAKKHKKIFEIDHEMVECTPIPHKKKHHVKRHKPKAKICHMRKRHRARRQREVVVGVEKYPVPIINRCVGSCAADCACVGGIADCEMFPPQRIICETINPADVQDFTCNDFPEKIRTCEPYVCQAPWAQDPSIKTKWEIISKNGERCVVASTTEDTGIRDVDGKPFPITQTCEYDPIGVRGLIRRFRDMQGRYYHFSTCEHFYGIHNCSFTTLGRNINDVLSTFP